VAEGLQFWFPGDDRGRQTSAVESIIYGLVLGLATAAVVDVVDIIAGCTDPSIGIIAYSYVYFLPMFGTVPALIGAASSAAFDGWFAARIGLKAGRIVMFIVIAALSVVFLLTGFEGKSKC
jgi:hypothetical protein